MLCILKKAIKYGLIMTLLFVHSLPVKAAESNTNVVESLPDACNLFRAEFAAKQLGEEIAAAKKSGELVV